LFEPEFQLEFQLEPVEVEPEEAEVEPEDVDVEPEDVDVEPEDVEPELEDELEDEREPEPEDEREPEPAEVPADDEPDGVSEEAVLCVDPGRASATMPAAATLAIVTVVVADRTLARPRSLSATAWRTRSRCALLMCPILRSRARRLSVRTFSVGYEADGLPRRPWPDVT
jgi:hypothetical protein